MTTHTPTLTDHTFTCPACAFRAVLTTDGRIVLTQAGDAGHDHIGQARAHLAAIRCEAERACAHLQRQYAANRLDIRRYRFLIRQVIAEYSV